jgi:uncharacterized membrane protein
LLWERLKFQGKTAPKRSDTIAAGGGRQKLRRFWHCAGPRILVLSLPKDLKEDLVAFCPNCGTQVADGASCPKCAGVAAAPPPAAAAGGLDDNVAGALAYVTIIPAIVFLVLEPFNRKRFVRFHAFQCIFFAIAWTILWVALAIFGHIPFLGWASLVLWPLISLAGFVIWLVLVLKAYQGQMFKLPIIGDMAEKQAGA